MFEGDANLTIGGYLLSDKRSRLFTSSDPYMQASTGFCFRERDTYSPFDRLAAPFKSIIWIMNGIILLVSIVVILLTKKLTQKWRHFYIGGRLNRTPILNMWAIIFGNPIPNGRNLGTFARTLTILWIFLWFVIRNSYQGALYNYLQTHRLTSACDTIEKIRSSDCKIIAPESLHFALKDTFDTER